MLWPGLDMPQQRPGPNVTNYAVVPYYYLSGYMNSTWTGSPCFSGCDSCTLIQHLVSFSTENSFTYRNLQRMKMGDLGECCWDDHDEGGVQLFAH